MCELRCVRAKWFRTMNEAVEVTEKHMLGALCEDLGGANEQT